MCSVASLVYLSSRSAVQDKNLISECIHLLPKTGDFLYPLLQAAIADSRILSLNALLTSWPLRTVELRDCEFFNEEKAILMATCLQQSTCKLDVVDIRGCEIGYYGTSAFAKLAVNVTVSETMVSAMKLLDNTSSDTTNVTPPLLGRHLSLFLDCYVDKDNYGLVRDAITAHSRVTFLVFGLQVCELGTWRVCQLLSSLEVNFFCSSYHMSTAFILGSTNNFCNPSNNLCDHSSQGPFDFYLLKKSVVLEKLNVSMNSLETYGTIAVATKLQKYVNLTSLDLSYNNITAAIAAATLAQGCRHLVKLKKLNLTGNRLGPHLCVILRELSCKLTHLSINGCRVGEEELTAMASIDQISELQQLDLASNGLEKKFKPLRTFLLNIEKTLHHLDLSENGFHSQNVPKLCRLVKKLVHLKYLNIGINNFTAEDVEQIVSIAPRHTFIMVWDE